MEDFTSEGKTVGILLDLSLRHDKTGRRVIDSTKKALLKVIRETMSDGVDYLYLYHPQLIEAVEWNGDQVCALANYETDGWPFNTASALKQTLYVVASQDMTFRRYLIYITDRLQTAAPLEKAIHLNKKDYLEVQLVVVGIGDQHAKSAIEKVVGADASSAVYIHIDDPSEITSCLFKEKLNGEQNPCCPSGE